MPDPPVTEAANCWVWLAVRETIPGATDTVTGLNKEMVAVWALPFSAAVKVAV